MSDFNVKNLTSIQAIKKELLPLIDKNSPQVFSSVNNSEFNWLKDILDKNLDEYLTDFLKKKEPITSRFFTLDLEEHLIEATNLINKNLIKRNEIFEIETQAIMAGVEYAQFLTAFESDKKLKFLDLKSSFNNSTQTNFEEYNDAFNLKYDIILSSIKTKLSFHNQSGNPLNFSERINYLRDIYCDNIKLIYEKLIAVKRTLQYSFNHATHPLPNFLDITNNLDRLVWWLRDTVYAYEIARQRDYTFQKSFSLNNPFIPKDISVITPNPHLDSHADANKVLIPIKISEQIKTLKTNGTIEFDINEDDFNIEQNFFETNTTLSRRKRVLGISLSIIEQFPEAPNTYNQRETRVYYAELKPPKQNISLEINKIYDITEIEKQKFKKSIEEAIKNKLPLPELLSPKGKIIGIDKFGNLIYEKIPIITEKIEFPSMLVMEECTPFHNRNYLEKLDFKTENSIKNIYPVGKWTIYLKNITPNNVHRAYGLSQIEDVVITFKLGMRKS